ncbi:MAG: cobalamin biosynthesis protein CbiX [Burkholderiales bacterium PBB5]|nr:MAG: cobalamin biosynthesis protein CbiX [Burkholderiales bacterium PBB5]
MTPAPASPVAAAPIAGLLLFAHGARDPMWARPFEAVAARCRAERGDDRVALAFLEFMSPGMVAAGAQLAAAGCQAVDVVPLFLGAGGHVRKDIPVLMAQLEAEHPPVRFTLRPAVGQAPEVIAAMAGVALTAADTGAEVAVR